MARVWSDQDLKVLRSRATVATIAKKLDRSESSVRAAARRHGVKLRGSKAARRPGGKPETKRTARRPLLSAAGCASPELIAAFVGKHLKLVDGAFFGKPFVLEPFQRDDLIEPVFGTLDADGDRVYSEALFGIPRDGGKSDFSAALALALMFLEPVHRGKYVVIAKSRPQAQIVFEKAKYMVLNDPMLKAACDVRSKEIIVKATGQVFFTLPWDDGAAQGIHAQVVIIDEYHVHRNSSVYYAALSGMTHQKNSLLIAISTAAAKRQGPLWDLLKSHRENPNAFVHWIGADDEDDGHDPKVWKKANPQSWATPKSLKKAYQSMPFWEFERYHLNRFPQAEGLTQAFTFDVVTRNRRIPGIDPSRPVVLGLDVAPLRDRCALLVVQKDSEGVHHWQPFVWKPGRQMEYGDYELVKAQIRILAESGLYIVRIVADPAFVWLVLNELKAEGFPVESMRQDAAHMCAVADNLYRLLTGDKIAYDDDEVRDDLLNVRVMERAPYGWRMGKLDEDGHIDCAIAGGMASFVLESDTALIYSGPPIIVG